MKNPNIQVPNKQKLSAVEKLCLIPDPYSQSSELDELFFAAMKESILWHQTGSKFYAKLLNNEGFDLENWSGDLNKIPFISADFFKMHEIKSVAEDKITLHLTSSGTTGQKSQIFFDDWSIKSAQFMVDAIFSHYGWDNSPECNYLLYSYQPEQGSKLGTAYTDNFLTKYAPVKNVEYALKFNGKGGHDFDLYGCIRALQQYAEQKIPVRIFGFPAFFYFTLERMRDLKLDPIKLHADSLVFLGGGWKGQANKSITKEELYQLAEEILGIPNVRLRDGFGSVEHCVPYIECDKHHFHVPVYSRVLIRDLNSLQVLDYGDQGFIQFISPYITSMPAHSIMMGDLATKHRGNSCGCGLETDWFEIHGRAGISKNKSCAIAAAELLRSFT